MLQKMLETSGPDDATSMTPKKAALDLYFQVYHSLQSLLLRHSHLARGRLGALFRVPHLYIVAIVRFLWIKTSPSGIHGGFG